MKSTITRQCLALLLLSGQIATASTVYDDFTGFHTIMYAGDFGNTVTLAGTARFVNTVSVGLMGIGSGDHNLQLQLWTSDGPAGSPGSLIWQSGYLNFPVLDNQFQTITFDVPSVHVPDTLFWDLSTQSGNSQGGAISEATSVGSTGQGWTYLLQPEYTFLGGPFMADIEASVVPEPSALSFLALLAIQSLAYKARRRTRVAELGSLKS